MTNLEDALDEIDVLAAAEAADATPTKSALDDKILDAGVDDEGSVSFAVLPQVA